MDEEKIMKATRMFLEGIGEDPDRPGLVETPRRVAQMAREIYSGHEINPDDLVNIVPGEDHDEMIILKDILLLTSSRSSGLTK